MDYRINNTVKVVEVSEDLYFEGMSPRGRAKRHGLMQSPIEWPRIIDDTSSPNYNDNKGDE
jgi:hypothetical protein